jgi:hypothetical protein
MVRQIGEWIVHLVRVTITVDMRKDRMHECPEVIAGRTDQ